jgi:hypothetical protein
VFPAIEHRIESAREARTYEVTFKTNYDKFRQLEAQFSEFGLRVRSHKQIKRGEEMTAVWDVIGTPTNHDRAVEHMFADADIKEFRF